MAGERNNSPADERFSESMPVVEVRALIGQALLACHGTTPKSHPPPPSMP